MLSLHLSLSRLARRLGGTRVLALPLLRALAVLAGATWVLLAPRSLPQWEWAAAVVLAFFVYSVGVAVALWHRPSAILRRNVYVLLADLAFALTLIALTGGARSTLFLALLLIAALQSYYWGIRRGLAVAVASAALYLGLVVTSVTPDEWANVIIRLFVLLGTAIGVGILADVEEAERRKVLALTADAQEREQFIRSVVESLRDGVVALDVDGRVIAWNHAMVARYGLTAGEMMGAKFLEQFPESRRASWAEPLRRLLAGEIEEFSLEAVHHETLRRGPATLNIKGSLLRRLGQPAGVVLVVEDITERVAFERSARQAEKMAALGTLAAGLAHELNNPIGIISSRVELMMLELDARQLPDELRQDLQVLHRHAQRVARIAQGLLSFSRQSPAQPGPIDVNQLVDETLLLVEKQIVKEHIGLKRLLAPGLPPVWGDKNALQQVLMNLLTNARDAVAGGGEIAVETTASGGAADLVQLTVRDTGPGIATEVLPRIFDPFFTTKPDGTGLGLSISYGIVRDHQGTVDVHTTPGEGTSFTVAFPALLERSRA